MRLIAFDESGNTGADLLNQQQRVFVLASTDLTIEESEELLSLVKTRQAPEAKFSRLRKSNAGQHRIIRFLQRSGELKDRIKTSFFHKEYMVVTKIVDLLIETIAHRDGIDLYKDGANIATANMHFYCMPAFCGKERVRTMHETFIKMIREQTDTSVNDFYYTMWQLHGASVDQSYSQSLTPILISEQIIHEILEGNDRNSLDPAIPAFFEHCANWGDELDEHFNVLHDESKPLFQEKESLELFMSKDISRQVIGYDRRKLGFPLKANGVFFGKSEQDPRLQVADLIASSSGYWAHRIASGEADDALFKELEMADIRQFALGALWPTPEVTPEQMGTNGGYGINAVNFIAAQLSKLRKPA
jgi:hypothetical protein